MTTWHLGEPPMRRTHPTQWNVLVVPQRLALSFIRFNDEKCAREHHAKLQAEPYDQSELFPPKGHR